MSHKNDSRIARAFSLKAKIAYLTAGDIGAEGKGEVVELSASYFLGLVNAGVNILEVGIPFSDPIADGHIIQEAMGRALAGGTNLAMVFSIIREIRAKTDIAIIIFTYYNLLFGREEEFLQQAQKCGVDGILVVDLPFEESQDLYQLTLKYKIDLINVIAPSTTISRLKQIEKQSSGFLYYACQKGTTGVRDKLPEDISIKLAEIKKHVSLPIAVGFGISNNAMVQDILACSDGCVVGSYFVTAIKDGLTPESVGHLAEEVFKNVN